MADELFDCALELVEDAGQTLLENGGEVFRAQQTMEIMAASLGVRDFHVYVLTNGIFALAHLPGRDAVSLVRHVPTVSVHLGRVEAVNELSRELAAGRLGVVEAEERLNTARTLPRSTPQLEILACVVGAAGFAYLFGGTLADMPVAAVAGLLEALVCQQFARHGINRIFTDIAAAFCGTIWAIAVTLFVPAVNANAAIIGALMVLTPGVALTMGVRDILNGQYLSGSIRLLDALLIAGSIAGGVVLGWIMASGSGWRDAGLDTLFCPFCGGRHCNDQLWHHIPDAAALPGLRPDRRGGLDGLHLRRGAVRVKPRDCDAGRHAR